MQKQSPPDLGLVPFALEVAAIAALFLLLHPAPEAGASFLALALVACLAGPIALEQIDPPGPRPRSFWRGVLGPALAATLIGTGAMAATAALIDLQEGLPLLLAFAAAQLAVLVASRAALGFLARGVPGAHAGETRFLLVVGSGPRAARLKRRVEEHPEWGFEIVGFLDDADTPVAGEVAPSAMRKLIEVRDVLRETVVDEVIVALPLSQLGELPPVVAACSEAGVPLSLLADLFGERFSAESASQLGTLPVFKFTRTRISHRGLMWKRTLDLTLGSALLLAAAPVIGIAALAIRATSRGPIFFRQTRCGLYARRFEMLKLRTMAVDAEERIAEIAHLNEMSGPVFKITNDPRITPVGRWLRRLSIDELPQLWNVVRGEMSLVGPRPPMPREVVQYSTADQRRLSVRPGVTGLWQVSGRNRVSDFADWVRLDLEYVDNWSIRRDLEILLKTIPAVLRATGQ